MDQPSDTGIWSDQGTYPGLADRTIIIVGTDSRPTSVDTKSGIVYNGLTSEEDAMRNALGTFKVESGKVFVSDPCYSRDTDGMVYDAVNGDWKATATIREGRVSILTAVTKDKGGKWERTGLHMGVDSGQMSIFDNRFYKKDSEGKGKCSPTWEYMEKDRDDGAFYGACCTLTCGETNGTEKQGGVLEHGCVSSTGWGDGSYPLFVKLNKAGKVVGVKVKFM